MIQPLWIHTVITNENNTYTFSASDFNFSDIDGDTLDSVKITNLEALGSLQLSGADVILNQVIIRTEIDAGNLKFVPVNNASGTGYDSFGFSVNDGTSDSSSSYTMTIDVNDAPTTSGIADVTVNENASNTVIDLFASFADTEDVDASLIYTITSNTNQGLFSTTPIDGSAGTLTLDYAPNTYGTASITVRATDSGGAIVESTFLVTVNSTNLAPAAVNDAYTVNEDSSLVADWRNTAWDQRQQLTFDNSAQTETLIDFPVLVVLNSGNIDYLQTQANGEDLRFVDNDRTFLADEIEEWNESGDSYVWVKIPQIDGASNTDSITMYYGNAAAVDAQDYAAVWNDGFEAVYHLNDDFIDSTVNTNDGINSGSLSAAGMVADGQLFDGQTMTSIMVRTRA